MEKCNLNLARTTNKEISMVITPFNKVRIFRKIGYSIDNGGFLIDEKDKELVKAEDGKSINVNVENRLALIGGSHNFVRNIAGYSNYLSSRGSLKFQEKKD